EPLERETEVPPGAAVPGALLHHLLQLEARLCRLPRLQVGERQVDARLQRVGVQLDELLVDGDRPRVEPQPEVDDAEEVLPLGIERLERERLLELGLGVVDAVVLEELAAPVEMEEEILPGHVTRARRRRTGSLALGHAGGSLHDVLPDGGKRDKRDGRFWFWTRSRCCRRTTRCCRRRDRPRRSPGSTGSSTCRSSRCRTR